MTTSCWDDEKIRSNFSECKNLKEVIIQIESEFEGRGEVICEVMVNGLTMDEKDEARFAESPLSEIREIAVKSKRPSDLIRAALDSAVEFIPRLEGACLSCADKFRGTDARAAQTSFEEAIEGFQWLIETFLHIRGAASGIGDPIHHVERWAEAERTARTVVQELMDAYQKKDFVLVSDLLEYEVTGVLGVWKQVAFTELKMRACKDAQTGGTSMNDTGSAQDSMG